MSSSDDIEMSQDNLKTFCDGELKPKRVIDGSSFMNYMDEGDNDDEDDDDFDEETHFVTKNRSSFYTSSERT